LRIGCVFTLKNEEDLIAPNIRYHRFLGVTDFFAFLDYSTDRTKSILQATPNVRIFENLSYADMLPYSLNKPKLDLDLIREKFEAHNGVRQIFHANMALELCRREKIDWLISIDPDELICLDTNHVGKDSLKDYLLSMGKSVGALIFRNIEVVPTRVEAAYPFEDRLFKNAELGGDSSGLPKTEVFDPYTGVCVPAGWYWGHTSGKLVVRVLSDSYFAHLTHLFQTEGDIKTADLLLHYNIFSYKQFVAKYCNFKDFPKFTSLGRPVRPLRALFVKLANDSHLPKEYLMDYYKKYILYTAEEIETIRRKYDSAFVEISSISKFFRS
jgi:hypothetical protein